MEWPEVRVDFGEFRGGRSESVEVTVMRVNAAATELHTSVCEKMNGGSGFIRGREGKPCYITSKGEVITDPGEMRRDCLTVPEHMERVWKESGREIVAVTTFGDLMTNVEYLVFRAEV